ncbi:MAG: 16S rRNA (cytosine(1402)-N(4))-methyltransferase [Candidatus Doudnabacteria bacterium RIFCSPHIGHO2_01_FULL_46_14]|uniref:Ribosomal RNA small subunit methyltransferase H n=1 Tax=Candidatus Doudnabacteria bacterium RIFCSPHIGHO2_01_FULL_46_14 TaxID=1817824 RepID=A0A1F5NPD6_9BACT|nr:MAG: 16S rRNA (cytosine(1402)-N(4))-methyltransferase [Candidatus Doudnabacteria bacterium RIFCSPHIGHO2_01_FULL_46_14]
MLAHTPVLLNEVIGFFDPKPGKKFIDATVGRAGHANQLVNGGAEVLGVDTDSEVVAELKSQSASRRTKIKAVVGNFGNLKSIAEENDFTDVDGILMDLGLGSHQLDDSERGFSFQKDGPLDMRFDAKSQNSNIKTAGSIVNFYAEKDLLRIFFQYGEEKRFGKRIVGAIMARRKLGSINTTGELFELIKQALPGQFRFRAGDTARKIFQALRIEVNDELGNLERGLQQAVSLLKSGGRLVVISFHSLEDRIVKQFFVREARDCVCPPSFPVCRCDARARLRILTKKPVMASGDEARTNSRARSAKLRAAEKI